MAATESTKRLEEFAKFAHHLADIAGPITLKSFRRPLSIGNKATGGAFDPVTKADRAVERAISSALGEHFPDHGLVGEEYGTKQAKGPYSWVIDPIDGTRAYIMGSPLWGTLIGVLEAGKPIFGLMDQPFTRERTWSANGRCLFRLGESAPTRIKSRRCATLADAILTTTHPDLFEGSARRRTFNALSRAVRMTRFGGDCYSYGLLAAGHIDLVVESGLKPYDIVALIPIIEGAGGVVTTWSGGAATDGGDIVACGDPALHAKVLRFMAQS